MEPRVQVVLGLCLCVAVALTAASTVLIAALVDMAVAGGMIDFLLATQTISIF